MMKTTRFIALTLVFSCLATFGWAQDYAFRVMANKGANKANGEALMIGSKIKTGTIEVAQGGYLGLAHISGKTVEIKEPGKVEVSKLAEAVKAKGNVGAASRYMNFVVDELTQKKDGDAMARRYRHMSKTGSASRAMPDADKKIRLLLPIKYGKEDKMKNDYLGNFAVVDWYVNDELKSFDAGSVSGKYKVVVMDMGEQELFTVESNDTYALIDLNDSRLKDVPVFLYKVVDSGDASVVSMNHIVKSNNPRLKKAYGEEFAQLPQENTAIAALVRAKFFEEKGLLSDAMAAYTQAVSLAPEVETYQQMRAAFLERAKITKEADQARSKEAVESAGEK